MTDNIHQFPIRRCITCGSPATVAVGLIEVDSGENAGQKFFCEAHAPKQSPLKVLIAHEIYKAAEALGASPDLLAIIGSYGDTLSDDDVLDALRLYNETGKCLIEPTDIN